MIACTCLAVCYKACSQQTSSCIVVLLAKSLGNSLSQLTIRCFAKCTARLHLCESDVLLRQI